jgi:predicted PurR-regulated permease PerM
VKNNGTTTAASTDAPPQPADASSPPRPEVPASWTVAQSILAVIATIFALHWAQRFFIPLMLGIVAAYTLNPLVAWLERRRVPRTLGSSLVMLVLVCAVAAASTPLGGQAEAILDRVPEAVGKLSASLRSLSHGPNAMQKMQAAARELEQATKEAADGAAASRKAPTRVVVEEPRFTLVDLLWTGSLGMFGLLGDAVMLLLLILFLLMSGDTFKRKLIRLTGPSLSDKKITVAILDDIDRSIQNYMLTLLTANVLLALLTWALFRAIGLDNAGAWGVAAGVLHFIPYVGPLVTAFATGMAGLLQFGSLTMALVVAGGSLAVATLVGMILMTWMCGKMAKMNATAVFIGLLFWGWLWGAWGLLLAVPIMGMIKVCAEHVEDLHPVAELLGE